MALSERIAALVSGRWGEVFAYTPPQHGEPRTPVKRAALPTKSDYAFFTWNGTLDPPDEVIKKFGGWEGLGLYDRILRQFPNVYSACQQRIDRVPERRIVPGDPSNPRSVEVAKICNDLYQGLEGREIIQRRLLWGMFYGFAAVEKTWAFDDYTGLFAPIKLYDQPARNIRFDEQGNPFFMTAFNRTPGEPLRRADWMFFRWGSHWTPYGDGELKYVYVLTWMIQQMMDFGLQALEELGRPIPVYHVPQLMDKDARAALEASVAAQHKFYVMVPTDATEVKVEFPGINVTAGGAAGRSEGEWIRYFDGWIQRALLGTQQTQDRSGGSRALEEVRTQIVDDKTRQASDTLDDVWNRQWLWPDVIAFNFADLDRMAWPRFDSEPMAEEDLTNHHERVMEAMGKGIPVSRDWYYQKFKIVPPQGDDDRFDAEEKTDGNEAES